MAFNSQESNRQTAGLLQNLSREELALQLQRQRGQITEEELNQGVAQIEQKREGLFAAVRQQS